MAKGCSALQGGLTTNYIIMHDFLAFNPAFPPQGLNTSVHPSPRQQTFAHRLRELMSTHSLTQIELASLIGLSQSRVSDWLNSKALPQPRSMRALATALRVDATWLLTGESRAWQPLGTAA